MLFLRDLFPLVVSQLFSECFCIGEQIEFGFVWNLCLCSCVTGLKEYAMVSSGDYMKYS